MRAPQVRKVLESLRLDFDSTLYGFLLRFPGEHQNTWRIESGGGIAGRSGEWGLVEIHGRYCYPKVATMEDLKKQLCHFLTSPETRNLPGRPRYEGSILLDWEDADPPSTVTAKEAP